MRFSTLSNMESEDADTLNNVLANNDGDNVLAVCASSNPEGDFAWISCRSGKIEGGCGALSKESEVGLETSAHDTKIFSGDRILFQDLLARFPESERQGWTRSTFNLDCRLAGASGLHDEQEWCEAAFVLDGRPEEPTVYIVQVLGSDNYFGYFNIYWAPDDDYTIKSCHDLRKWTTLYLPRMYAERDVERWVFLREEDLATFGRAAGEYSRAFKLLEFPFEVFRARHTP